VTPQPAPYYLDCIHSGLLLYWRTLARARGMQLYQGDIEYVMSATHCGPERIFDAQLPSAGLDRRLEEIIAGIRAGSIPDSFVITPNARPADLPEALARKGFQIDTSGLCMAMDLDGWSAGWPEPANSIQVAPVESPDQLKQWVEITNVALAGSPIMSCEQFGDLYRLENTRFFLARYNGVPAAVSMTIHAGQAATLEFVSTLEEYRRRGLGAAVTAAALCGLRASGIRTVTLRGEPDGVGIYKRLGFQEYAKRVVASYPR
jgi:hypothetical protein